LCELLNNTGLFKAKFGEHFNLQIQNPKFMPYCKIQPGQWSKNNLTVQMLKDKFPGIKFIHLSRKNFFDKATSFYFANSSNIWAVGEVPEKSNNNPLGILSIFRQKKETYIDAKIEVNEESVKIFTNKLIWAIGKEKKIVEEIANDVGEMLEIDYDELIKNPNESLSKVLRYIGHEGEIKVISTLEKMPERKEKEQIKKMIMKNFIKLI
jgi:LPS sulfotransferase NodH